MRERRCNHCEQSWPHLRPHTTRNCPLKPASMVKGRMVSHRAAEPVKRKKLRSRGSRSPDRPKRNFDMNLHLLECPICTEFFTPPVYQCQNGHITCGNCCVRSNIGCPSCEEPIDTRCTLFDKIVESLFVDCKHAVHGCTRRLQCGTERANHEKICEYKKTVSCPAYGCLNDGNKFTLPVHLTEQHEVPTVVLNEESRRVAFRMEPEDRMVMVKGIGDTMFLLHREFKDGFLGEIFFLTSFGVKKMKYDLNVRLNYGHAKTYTLRDSVADVQLADDCRDGSFLLYSFVEGATDVGYDIDLGIDDAEETSSIEQA